MKEYRRMNVLFLSIAEFDSIYQRELYPDLLREFMNNGHEIYVVSTDGRSVFVAFLTFLLVYSVKAAVRASASRPLKKIRYFGGELLRSFFTA